MADRALADEQPEAGGESRVAEQVEGVRGRRVRGIVARDALVGEHRLARLASRGELVSIRDQPCRGSGAGVDGRTRRSRGRHRPGRGLTRGTAGQQEQHRQGAQRSAHAACLVRGSSIVKQLPTPGVESTETVPWWASTSPFTTASPRPLPCRRPCACR